MTIKNLKSSGAVPDSIISQITDRVHQVAQEASVVNRTVFYHNYHADSPDLIYLASKCGEWRFAGKNENGFQITSSANGTFLCVTLAYPEKYVDDASATRRLGSLKNSLTVTNSYSIPAERWTDFLYRHPNSHTTLLAVLDFTLKTLRSIGVTRR